MRVGIRRLPKIMSTQHPDCAFLPKWMKEKVFHNDLEVEEVFRAFKLGCDEQLWDWEGKDVDSHVVRKLLSKHCDFFKENVIGNDVFITYRLPNPDVETQEKKLLFEALESIPKSADIATSFYEKGSSPVFEVALPMTTSHLQLLRISSYYQKIVVGKQHLHLHPELEDKTIAEWVGKIIPEDINIIPLIEDKKSMLAVDSILKEFIKHKKPEYVRPWLARSDTALNYGLLSAVLMLKYALSKINEVEKETGVNQYPILGVGSLPFRGHLRPENIDNFLEENAGFYTFTFQSAMKYDFDEKDVKKAIKKIKSHKLKKPVLEEDVLGEIKQMIDISSERYRDVIPDLADIINKLSKQMPHRRMRKLHIGLFGYSREFSQGIHLPRAINFTGSLYSVGLPPELIGLSALKEIESKGLDILEKVYPTLKEDLNFASGFVSIECLNLMEKKNLISDKLAESIRESLECAESFFSIELGAKTKEQERHATIAKQILSNIDVNNKNKIEIQARIRKSIG